MESRQLLTAADRALRSCSLLRSRIQSLTPALTTPSRTLTTTTPAHQDASSNPRPSSPRHASVPPPPPGQVRMPFRLRPAPSQPPFKVNTDASVLDSAYVSLLGRGGDLLLPSDLKWLAVTHKSFDHGWQGNNDRLAFLGKRIVDLQVSLSLVAMPRLKTWGEDEEGSGDQGGAISGLENLTVFAKTRVQDPRRLAGLAREKGLERVVRWKPRKTSDLQSSGVDTVLAHTLYAIVGALSLQRGGDTTTQLVKERILAPLGLRK
ncbi:54S ribosomal protein L15, mitochondrial [Elsinoe australis]|uniref:54S ribosomal protein L15, mitochondrial n=1 Tax=Elsinoe australis TaxID=40998 RepID=A0A2P7YL54_9PEZI|nr:54S ribosomal protein L15, mitochondrial [Elsinoe australis]